MNKFELTHEQKEFTQKILASKHHGLFFATGIGKTWCHLKALENKNGSNKHKRN
jgi:hypothetical protein